MRAPNDFDDPTSEELLDPQCVCYCLSSNNISAIELSAFGEKVLQDLTLRNQYIDDGDASTNFLHLQSHLIVLMKHEGRIRKIKFDLDHGHSLTQSDAAFLVLDSLPCSMHGEVRNTTKFVTVLLTSALTRAVVNAVGSQADAILQVKNRVTYVMSINVLGSLRKPHHWKFPWDFKSNSLGKVSFDHGTTNKLMLKINLLIDVCLQFPSGEDMTLQQEKQLWYKAMAEYNKATVILNRKTNLERDEIYRFQYHVDQFAKLYVRDLGKGNEGVNNYLHMYISGHYFFYLLRHKSLYRHNQQGWEHLNGVLKRFIHRRTNRGGGRGATQRILPLARYLSRRWAFLTGKSYEEMEASVGLQLPSQRHQEYAELTAMNDDSDFEEDEDEQPPINVNFKEL